MSERFEYPLWPDSEFVALLGGLLVGLFLLDVARTGEVRVRPIE